MSKRRLRIAIHQCAFIQVPIGSDAELRMQRQLLELERKTREMRSSMERIAAKEKYQMRQIDEEKERKSADKNSRWR